MTTPMSNVIKLRRKQKYCHPELVEEQMFFVFDYKKVFDKFRLTAAWCLLNDIAHETNSFIERDGSASKTNDSGLKTPD